mmetsp:Transcript_282/g.952  ORF Transcript_282/g.952 Transcript_282/m.952 type:complete len:202 (-) Transcript_282:1446-2051(-)
MPQGRHSLANPDRTASTGTQLWLGAYGTACLGRPEERPAPPAARKGSLPALPPQPLGMPQLPEAACGHQQGQETHQRASTATVPTWRALLLAQPHPRGRKDTSCPPSQLKLLRCKCSKPHQQPTKSSSQCSTRSAYPCRVQLPWPSPSSYTAGGRAWRPRDDPNVQLASQHAHNQAPSCPPLCCYLLLQGRDRDLTAPAFV